MRVRHPYLRVPIVAVLSGVIALSLLGSRGGVARAEDATLGGFQGTATSSGLHAYYTPEGLLPISPLLDIGAPDALATIASGPATFARASAADPGDLIANPDAILTLAAPGYPQGTVPAYPYRVSATSGFGSPSAESSPAPGLEASAKADATGSTAESTMPKADAPAVATFGSLATLATTTTDGSTVSVHVHTEAQDVNLLDIVKIDSIVTDLVAASSGADATLSGATTVTGAEMMGKPVTIDAKGVHGPGGDLNGVLGKAGITVTLADPIQQGGANAAQRSSSGLRIDLELSDSTVPALKTLTDVLPSIPGLAPGAPTVDDLIALVRARHLTRIEVAQGAVSLSATPAADALIDLPLLPDGAPTADGSTVAIPDIAPSALGPTLGIPASPINASGAPTSELPEVPLGAGVGALAILALLVQPYLGSRIARMTAAVLGADDGISCPLEER